MMIKIKYIILAVLGRPWRPVDISDVGYSDLHAVSTYIPVPVSEHSSIPFGVCGRGIL